MKKTTDALKEDKYQTEESGISDSDHDSTVEDQSADSWPETDTETSEVDSLPEPLAEGMQPEKEHGFDYGEYEQGDKLNTRLGMILAHQRSMMRPMLRTFKAAIVHYIDLNLKMWYNCTLHNLTLVYVLPILFLFFY